MVRWGFQTPPYKALAEARALGVPSAVEAAA
jgi:hypothetical protein